MSFHGEQIWIIGASSGIGRALAVELSQQGATLVLSARNEEELHALNTELGGKHTVFALDVGDVEAVAGKTQELVQQVGSIDRAIFLAAIYKPADIDAQDIAFTRTMVEVNLTGAMAITYALLPVFEQQQQGQLVLCASVAGYTGLPGGQPYSATKAGLINFAESLHAEAPTYLDVKIICPGFVRTRMTDKNTFSMPMRIEPDEAAKAIAKGLKKSAFEIHFPKAFTYGCKLLHCLPYWLKLPLTRMMQQ